MMTAEQAERPDEARDSVPQGVSVSCCNDCLGRILVACEYSGAVRDAFGDLGWDAWSCDILPSETPGNHRQCDVFGGILAEGWDALIFFWPCTYLCRSGQQWLTRTPKNPKPGILYGEPRRAALKEHAYNFRRLLTCGIPRIAGENPRMNCHAAKIVGPSSQKIQPWEFGHGECKETHLWLRNLPPLMATDLVSGREQRIFNMSPGKNRGHERSRTFAGIAKAMANQWTHAMRLSFPMEKKERR